MYYDVETIECARNEFIWIEFWGFVSNAKVWISVVSHRHVFCWGCCSVFSCLKKKIQTIDNSRIFKHQQWIFGIDKSRAKSIIIILYMSTLSIGFVCYKCVNMRESREEKLVFGICHVFSNFISMSKKIFYVHHNNGVFRC